MLKLSTRLYTILFIYILFSVNTEVNAKNSQAETFRSATEKVSIGSGSTTIYSSANIPDGHYFISYKSDLSKVVDIYDWSKDNEAIANIYNFHGGDNQIFYLKRMNDGTYKITCKNSLLSLEVRNSSHENEASIAQWEYLNGYDCKKWYIIDAENEYYKFANKESGKCMDVQGNSTNNRTVIQQFDDNGTDAQRFKLELLFRYTTINCYYLLNNKNGAKNQEHNAVLLRNCFGDGVHFSFSVKNDSDIFMHN